MENLDLLPDSWTPPWQWWPLVIVLIGLGMIFRARVIRSIIVVLAALLLGFLLTGFFHFGSCFWRDHGRRFSCGGTQEIAEPFGEEIESANLRIDIAGREPFPVSGVSTLRVKHL